LDASDIVHLHTKATSLSCQLATPQSVVSKVKKESQMSLWHFQLAGAKTVIATLWAIRATTVLLLMKRF